MRQLPSRLRRLDGALADLPLEEPMLLSELDGFLTGLLAAPEAVPTDEWMAVIWGSDDGGGVAPFEDPLDVAWFAEAVAARRREIARDLSQGRLRPLFDTNPRSGETLWEEWLDGFADAVALRPEAWDALAEAGDPAVVAMTGLSALFAVAAGESALDSVEINALHDRAPAEIVACVAVLHTRRGWVEGTSPAAAAPPSAIGRNDPCACGSGRKSKRCCR